MGKSPRDLAGYRLVAGLGEGGMARVYLALSRKAAGFTKLVVLKVLRSSTVDDPSLRRMFFDEARIAALLNHPNVVQTYEAGEADGRLFLAMEYLEGKALSSLLAARPPGEIALDVQLRVIADMLEGLHYAHDVRDIDGSPLDIVHRDVSPQNVLVTFNGLSKVVDFGIAKINSGPMTESGVIKGKVGYMAPEQIKGRKIDRRADVYATGIMLWEAIAKRRLVLRGDDEVAVIARRMNGEDPSIRSVAPPGTPEELVAICERAMQFDPEQRHATALVLHDEIDGYLKRTGGASRRRVGEVLESVFGDERSKTQRFVEEQLRNADDSAPILDVGRGKVVALTALDVGSGVDDLPQVPKAFPDAQPHLPTSAAHTTDVMAEPPDGMQRKVSPSVLAFVAIMAAAAVIGIVLIVVSFVRTRNAQAAAIDTATPVASTVARPPTAHLVVRTNADGAKLIVDDRAQPLPYDVHVARGTSLHLVTQAPGFVDYDRTLVVDEDTNLDIALSPAPTAVASTKPDAGAKAKPKHRAIDDGDPYRR